MTMHLVTGMSSLNTRKPQSKTTKTQLKLWQPEWRADNKWRQRQGLASQTFEQYVAYREGKTAKQHREFVPLTAPVLKKGDLDDHRERYPSQEMSSGVATRKEPMQYSGERKLLGIATMHKSNMVPVFDQESAIDIARMRRN
jgi:hypothetical protein